MVAFSQNILGRAIQTIVFSAIFFWLLPFNQGQAMAAEFNAFILHSYHQEYPWTKHQHLGLIETITESFQDRTLYFSTEYLDTKRIDYTPDYEGFFAGYLQKKYADFSPDIIFLTDDNALRFMINQGRHLFPDTPVVFCGVNDIEYAEANRYDDFYGVFEIKDTAANLKLIKELFPEVEKVSFVGDNSSTYQVIYRQILTDAAVNVPRYELSFIAHKRLDQIENLVRAIAGEVVVLTTIGAVHNRDGSVMSIPSFLKRFRAMGDYAIISMEDVYISEGILGGIVVDGKLQGSLAASLGVKILNGEEKTIADQFIYATNTPTFEYAELQRLGLSPDSLPAGSVVLNPPRSLYKEFRRVVFLTLSVFVVLMVLVVFLFINILRRREVEKELKAKGNFLNSVLDNLPDMVFVKRAEDLLFVSLNKAGEKFFGASEEEVVGRSDYDLFPQKEADYFIRKDREVLNRCQSIDIPLEPIQTRSGQRFLHTKKIPITGQDGDPHFLLGISRDITEEIIERQERRELEEKLKQSMKMESIGTLAGGIAHDFNNILTSIIGYTELALLRPDIGEGGKNLLNGTLKGAARAKDLVRQILVFSRKSKQELRRVILAEIMEETFGLLRSTIPSTISKKMEIHSRNTILADPTQIHQVIMNLCTNGYQAMQMTGGDLRLALFEIDAEQMKEILLPNMKITPYLHLAVSDTGVGMEKDVLDKMFDPYFTTKGPEAGTGLGLAVVHGIVKNHGGYISAESEISIGTTINVYLPVAESCGKYSAHHQSEVAVSQEKVRHGVIMLIDDETTIVDITENYLTMQGYEVISFLSSGKALAEYATNFKKYDLIITDMTMPDLTGEQLSGEILKINPEARIILCTGYNNIIDREKALAMGIRKYLEKPVSFLDLLEAVDDSLS